MFDWLRYLARGKLTLGLATLILGWLAALPVQAALSISNMDDGAALNPHVDVLLDADGTLSMTQAVNSTGWLSTEGKSSFGFSDSVFWFRLELKNDTRESLSRFVEVEYPPLDHIQLLEVREGEENPIVSVNTGDRTLFKTRMLIAENYVFSIALSPGQVKTIYWRIQSGSSIKIPMTMWSPSAYRTSREVRQMLFGFYYGIFVVLCIYNFFIYLTTRYRSYLYYCLWVAGFVLFESVLHGDAYRWFWSDSPVWNEKSLLVSAFLGWTFGMLFTDEFLDLKKHYPRWSKVTQICAFFAMSCGLLAFFFPYALMIRLVALLIVVYFVYTTTLGVVAWKQGVEQARFFALSWLGFGVGGIALGLNNLGLLPATALTHYGVQAGAVWQVLLSSFALGHRFKLIREEKDREAAERKDAQDALVVALENAEESNRLKSEFLANISHELRTPLNAVVNVPRLLMQRFSSHYVWKCPSCEAMFEDDDLDAENLPQTKEKCPDCNVEMVFDELLRLNIDFKEARGLLKRSQDSGTYLQQLISELLDYSRIESDTLKVHPEPILVSEIREQLFSTMVDRAMACGLELRWEGPGAENFANDVWIHADPMRLTQVIVNLVNNAIKFTDTGSVSVYVSETTTEHLTFKVEDTGIGIPADALELIFEGFRQVDGTHTRSHDGAGLGLAISQRIVQLHGSNIQVASKLGEGSQFWFEIPLWSDPDV